VIRWQGVLGLALALVVTAGAARADWRDDLKVLRVGVLTGQNTAYRLAQMAPFRRYLQDSLGIPVELVPAADYATLIDAEVNGRVQYALDSAASYATAAELCGCVEPLAVPVQADGSTGIHAVMISRIDGPILSLAEARGARLAVGPPDSVAGHLVPFSEFARAGIEPESYFGAVVEVADPEQAVSALLAGQVDAALAWSTLAGDPSAGYGSGVFGKMVSEGTLDMSRIRLAWQSPLIPYGPHTVRSDLPEEAKDLLRSALANIAERAPDALDAVARDGAVGFAPATPEIYAPVAALVASR
jgi:phosphonate transport system substrate-binding protein